MYLFFDTETTGLPKNYKAPVTDVNNWPRLVQIAWHLYDASGNLLEKSDFIIKPSGFTIPVESSKVHGITTDKAMAEGQDLTQVMNLFNEQINKVNFLVAHNISFDEKIVGAEFIRTNLQSPLFQKTRLCTMNASTNYCKIQGPYGYKWPKLQELHNKLFGTNFEEAHNAAADIEATARCFWKMRELKLI
jgi:DNA polymerase III subunit epsilon